MKITIEDINETAHEVEVTYFIDNGDLQEVSIDKADLLQDIIDNDLNTWHEDKWDYSREEHYTVAHSSPLDEYLEENMNEVVLGRLYALLAGKELAV